MIMTKILIWWGIMIVLAFALFYYLYPMKEKQEKKRKREEKERKRKEMKRTGIPAEKLTKALLKELILSSIPIEKNVKIYDIYSYVDSKINPCLSHQMLSYFLQELEDEHKIDSIYLNGIHYFSKPQN